MAEYSENVKRVLAEQGISVGDRVLVERPDSAYEGILMPNHEFSDPEVLIIKLDNGYNIGVRLVPGSRVKKVSGKAPQEKRKIRLSFNPRLPGVSLITTGGTITSRVDYETGGVVSLMSPEELLSLVPELADIVFLREVRNPFNEMSEDMMPWNWQALANDTVKALNESEGVIITHGTDTLHYTTAALSFMIQDLPKPVVLTGAQRSSDRPSTDAAMNLLCSARIAGHSDIAHVGICMHASMNDDYCNFILGTRARKMHTSRRDAFQAINDTPLARVWPSGRIEVLKKDYRKRTKGEARADAVFEEKTGLLHAFPGSPEPLHAMVDKGYRGIVIAGTGLGHVPRPWLDPITRAIESGAIVCIAPQTLYGRLNPFVYSRGRREYEQGVLFLEDMLPETAYVKLGWLLGHEEYTEEEVKKKMLEPVAGEISKRSLPGGFV